MGEKKYIITNGENETIKLGKYIGQEAKSSQLILLKGELGSGKTRLVKGMAKALNLKDNVSSPTYNLVNEYRGYIALYHFDLYRLDSEMDLINIGFEDYLYRDGIVVIEWPELALDFINDDYLLLKFKFISEKERKIEFEAKGKNSKKLLKGLSNYVNFRN
ncbi:MAG: tRNA (adenosine(37)-N6)-threonylcarbamoyltransferase complex ATPase subunit type 1 TsaE [Bacillota bacterium]